MLYAINNPIDSDDGYHPQNLFRLVTKKTDWRNLTAQAYFKIDRYNFSASPNRNASNGLLLMSRYQAGGQTLYYAGLRVDGTAVIKKKLNGRYTTLGQKTLFAGRYDREREPALLPGNKWIGLRSETITNADGSVTIKLYSDIGRSGRFTLALAVTDQSSPIKTPGAGGVRTDFMDVSLDDIWLLEG